MNSLIDGNARKARVFLAHGAGAGMNNWFIEELATCLASEMIEIVRFNFPYMQKMEETGKRRPPDTMSKLKQAYLDIITQYDDGLPCFLLGKSMGGRVATMLVDKSTALACFVVGYPFHPVGQPDRLRIEHLGSIRKPIWIYQGTRDKLGFKTEVADYPLDEKVNVVWFEDGDHDLKPRRASGHTQSEYIAKVTLLISEKIDSLLQVSAPKR